MAKHTRSVKGKTVGKRAALSSAQSTVKVKGATPRSATAKVPTRMASGGRNVSHPG